MPGNIPNIGAPIQTPPIGAPQATPDYSALLKATAPNPLMQLTQALGQFPEQQQQAQLAKLQIQQGKQAIKQGDMQMEQAQRDSLDQQWTRLGSMIKARPDYAQDPTMIDQLTKLAQQRGVPVPLDANGHIDTTVFKTPWDSLDPAAREKLTSDALERDAGPARDAFLSEYSGVPPSLQTGPKSYSAKMEVAMSRAKAMGLKDADEGAYAQARADHLKNMEIPGTEAYRVEAAKTAKYTADAQAALLNAQSRSKDADAAHTRAQAAMVAAQKRGLGGDSGVRAAVADTLRSTHDLNAQIVSLRENYIRLSQVSDDPANDPQMQAIQDQIAADTKALGDLQQDTQVAQEWISNNLGTATTLHQQNPGKPQPTVRSATPFTPPSGYIQGKTKSGAVVWGKPNAPGTPLYDANGQVIGNQ